MGWLKLQSASEDVRGWDPEYTEGLTSVKTGGKMIIGRDDVKGF